MPDHPTRPRARGLVAAAALVMTFTAAPVAGYLDRNREEITGVATVVRLGAVSVGVALVALAATLLVARRTRPAPAGAAVAAVAFVFFQWSWFAHGPLALRYAQWLAASAASAWAASRTARNANGLLFLAVLGVGLLVTPSASYLSWRSSAAAQVPASADGAPPTPSGDGDSPRVSASQPAIGSPIADDLPNVYFFVLDGYGRADRLAATSGHDDSDFLAALGARGFDVRDDAFASYPATYLSITSMLDMDHVATRPSDLDGGHRTYYPRLQGDNAAVRALHHRGYTYVHAESGTYDGTKCGGPHVDVCIPAADDSHGIALDEVEFSLMRLTPARPLLDAGILPLGDRYTDPERVADALPDIRSGSSLPLFVFAHVVAPHAPYRRSADCSHLSRNVGAIGEGWETHMSDDYTEALQCVQVQTVAAMDTILGDDPDAIIVLTGDHGTAFTVDFEAPLDTWTTAQISERYPVFHASRVPPRCATTDPDAANIVNALRVVIACIDGREPLLLEPRAFLYRYGEHEVVEIEDLGPMQRSP